MRAVWLLARRTLQAYGRHNCSQMAAAISYYVAFSIVPLLIFLASVFGLVARNADVQREVIDRVVEATPLEEDEGKTFVADSVKGLSRVSGPLSAVGVLGMLWSASAMFGAIRRALNVVWGANGDRPFAQQRLIDLGMALGLGFVLGASVAAATALQTLRSLSSEESGPLSAESGFFWSVLPLFVSGVITFVVFLLAYRYVPNVPARLKDLWPGALLAAVLFEALKNGFAVYVAHFNRYDVIYGSLGAAMLFLLWTYAAASILLMGAELSAEWARLREETGDEIDRSAAERPSAALRRYLRGLFFRGR